MAVAMMRAGTEQGAMPMNGMKAAVVVMIGTALAACQRTPEKKAASADAQTLEQRIAALEKQAPPSTAAPVDPAGLTLTPDGTAPAAGYVERSAPAYVEPVAPAAPARRAPATTSRRTTPRATAPARTASSSTRSSRPAAEPVERIGGGAEPIDT